MFNVVNRIDELCKSKGWTYYELGKRTGISANTIYNWKNRGSIPTLTMLDKICDAFGISVEIFFCGIGSESNIEERNILKEWNLLSDKENESILMIIETFHYLKSR